MMAELLGRVDGYCKGKGGSMHIADFSLGILGANGIVGGGLPIATGSGSRPRAGPGRSDRLLLRRRRVQPGRAARGPEPRAIWKLPVVYLCENNHYTEWMRTEDITAGAIADRAKPFGVPGVRVDGNDVLAVRAAAAEAVERARRGDGPTLIEADTYRQLAHNEGEEVFSGPYRPQDEMDAWRARDPLARFRAHLLEEDAADADRLDEIERQESENIEAALAFAQESPLPAAGDALDDLYARRETA